MFLFLLRVTPVKRQRQVILFTLGLIAAWTFAALISIALQCAWQLSTWEALEVVGSLFEVAIVILALWVVWSVQLRFEDNLLVATGFRLASFDKLGFTVDPTLLEASYVCWTQTEMNYSVISATIPTATTFVKELNTHYGAAHGVPSNRNAYGPAFGSVSNVRSKRPRGTMRSDDVPLSTLKPGRKKISDTADSWDQFQYLGSEEDISNRNEIRGTQHPPDFSIEASARGTDQAKSRPVDSTSVESGESQWMIIRKGVAWHVRRD
ncbi:hypothetical protein LTR35_017314 [Friedmanniomyces endolithicus]|nr:hypothetical protein LTS09_017812 [Friedmanniomyces endolithicus]KAK0264619.1 hypothetical protein LTR35_017314 [Friedmanniomyces endolithicus]KAK0270608.1 hypothetical protein LTS00_016890 [Friedmanniomyces endolithicus]KAK0302757.1 hypothetical protein LTR01_008524 [Friedmanniomyces endolithicus]KAK0823301.1 hypothetical protein LTR73_008616 [Friedmanniomyces endolithicus]